MQDNIEITDQELARHARDGSASSFEHLVYRYEDRVFRFLLKCARSEDDARELTQITFVTAFQSLHQYDPALAFAPWLFTIARRKFIDHCRRNRFDSNVIPEGCDHDDPSAILQKTEHHHGVWTWARRSLSGEQFQALWFFYQEQLTVKEIARALDRSVISVKVMLFRAKKTLARTAVELEPNMPVSDSPGRHPRVPALRQPFTPQAP